MFQLSTLVAFLVASTCVSASHHFKRHHHVPLHLRAETPAATDAKDVAPETNSTEASSNGAFVHPGVFVSQASMDFIKEQVDAKKEPWASAFDQMMDSEFLQLSREPSPSGSVDCGQRSQNPGNGCTNEREDAMAAYGQALAFGITGDAKHAEKAVDIMDAWAGKIKTHTADNAPLQTGWSAASWARAGELIKHTYKKWDSASFEDMLKNVYLPALQDGDSRTGNWDLVMLESAIGISVFLDDRGSYESAMEKFKNRVPAYVYLKSDGKSPKAASRKRANNLVGFWQGQSDFQEDGIAQETCRDFVHTGYGLASISHVAETAMIQGENMYKSDIGDRLRAGVEFHSGLQLGADQPGFLCPGKELVRNLEQVIEPAFNAFSTQMGQAMPSTKKLVDKFRNEKAEGNALFVHYETLTHAGNPGSFGGSTGNSTQTPVTGDSPDSPDTPDSADTPDTADTPDSADVKTTSTAGQRATSARSTKI
jgi:hypothetical protein